MQVESTRNANRYGSLGPTSIRLSKIRERELRAALRIVGVSCDEQQAILVLELLHHERGWQE